MRGGHPIHPSYACACACACFMYGSPRRCAHRTQGCTLTYTLTHTYIPNPNQVGIDSTWPRGGPTDGGTRVTINGHGFTSLATAFGVRCRFNEVVVQAMPEEVTPTHTVCLLPPRDEDGPRWRRPA